MLTNSKKSREWPGPLLALGLALVLPCNRAGCQSGESKGRPPDIVDQAVAAAKMRGSQVAVVPRLLVTLPPPVHSIDDVLGRSSIVTGTVESCTVENEVFTLGTWCRFRITETLSQERKTVADGPKPSQSLGSLPPGRIWLALNGGEMVIDGITVRQENTPRVRLQVGGKYLLVVILETGGTVGVLSAMEDGVFELRAGDRELRPIKDSDLSRDLEKRGISSVSSMRTFLSTHAH
jgi:hypothetical protein